MELTMNHRFPAVKGVIFDLDGTLIDSMHIWTQVDFEYLQKRNIDVPADIMQDMKVGNSFVEIAKYFKERFQLPDSIEEIINEWTEMVAWHYQHDILLKPGALNFLHYLKQRDIKIAVGTSNTLYLTKTVLKANHVWQYIDATVDGCEINRGKPFPDIFIKAAEKLGLEPGTCLVIEDILAGVQAAKTAGMRVFAIADDSAENEREEINKQANFFAWTFQEIQIVFEQLRRE
jgi:HAD superfamily hydrolase (TIGR01509 family)